MREKSLSRPVILTCGRWAYKKGRGWGGWRQFSIRPTDVGSHSLTPKHLPPTPLYYKTPQPRPFSSSLTTTPFQAYNLYELSKPCHHFSLTAIDINLFSILSPPCNHFFCIPMSFSLLWQFLSSSISCLNGLEPETNACLLVQWVGLT